jgi:2,5-diketo-D-gluconate reductase A
MLELAAEGLIRPAGVSNFKPAHVAALIEAAGVAPAVNQIELSPALPRRDTVAYLDRAGVLTQAWGPLGPGHQVIPKSARPERQRATLRISGFRLSDAELAYLGTLDLGEDAAVDSDARVEF